MRRKSRMFGNDTVKRGHEMAKPVAYVELLRGGHLKGTHLSTQ
jgi:hypothetical protein